MSKNMAKIFDCVYRERQGCKESFGKPMLNTQWRDCEPATKIGISSKKPFKSKFIQSIPWTAPCWGRWCRWWRRPWGWRRWCWGWPRPHRWLSQPLKQKSGRRAIGCRTGKPILQYFLQLPSRGERDDLGKGVWNFEDKQRLFTFYFLDKKVLNHSQRENT